MKKALFFLVCINMSFSLLGQLTINHLNTNITLLSPESINSAKTTLHIAYAHTSHGSQLIDGMNGLVDFANGGGKGLALPENIFGFNNGGSDGALDLKDYDDVMRDVGYYPDWYNHTINYLGEVDPVTGRGTTNSEVNVMMWSWCGQAAEYTEQRMIDEYLNPMSQLESVYYNVKFVYMTCHLNGTGLDGNLHLRNEQIRSFCLANNKILYDFADIETYDPDGVYYGELFPTDACNYDASGDGYTSQNGDPAMPGYESGDRNWAIDWQDSHNEGVDWYNCGAAHSYPLNANMKAYAAWALFVGIADIINNEGVPDELVVTDTIVGDGETVCFNARETITVSGDGEAVEFNDQSIVNIISGGTINILPGFWAHSGSHVNAGITLDESFCDSGLKSTIVSNEIEVKKKAFDSDEKFKISEEKLMRIFPNPSDGRFSVELENATGNYKFSLYNSEGMKMWEKEGLNGERIELDFYALRRGIYYLKANTSGNAIVRKILIK